MKSIIKKVLKEEKNQKLKSKLLNMISSDGLVKTSRKVNGVENLGKILDTPIQKLIMGELRDKKFSTDYLERIGIITGGYDFEFEINEIQFSKPEEGESYAYSPFQRRTLSGFESNISCTITKGTVTLVMTDNDTYVLTNPKTRDLSWFWEVNNEIKDLIYEFFEKYFDKLNLKITDYDIWVDYA